MFTTVVWATDGSDAADRALPYAKDLVRSAGGKLVVVHCKEMLLGRASGFTAQPDEDEVEAKIQQQIAEIRAEGIDASFTLPSGSQPHAAHMIDAAAREAGADLIVVGTRGHTALAGLLVGSVTQRLLHLATCPVLAVPPLRES